MPARSGPEPHGSDSTVAPARTSPNGMAVALTDRRSSGTSNPDVPPPNAAAWPIARAVASNTASFPFESIAPHLLGKDRGKGPHVSEEGRAGRRTRTRTNLPHQAGRSHRSVG